MYKGIYIKRRMDYQTNQTLAKYTAQSQGNYYTYEEQQETEVPNEYIIKKHNLPQLPTEIINMILYKFGGLQNPIVKEIRCFKQDIQICKKELSLYYDGEEDDEYHQDDIKLNAFESFLYPFKTKERSPLIDRKSVV